MSIVRRKQKQQHPQLFSAVPRIPLVFDAEIILTVTVGLEASPFQGYEPLSETLRQRRIQKGHKNNTAEISATTKAAEREAWNLPNAQQVKVSVYQQGEKGRVLSEIASNVYDDEHWPTTRTAYK